MRSSNETQRRLVWTACLLLAAVAAVIGFTPACNTQAPVTGTGPDGPAENPVCRIVNLTSNVQVSTDSSLPVLVIYATNAGASSVRGFVVQVESALADSAEIGTEIVLPDELTAGENQSFNLDVSLLTDGFYRVGLRTVTGDTNTRCLSIGTLEVSEVAVPEFTEPAGDLTAEVGEDVRVGIDLNDASGALHWRLFYLGADDAEDVPVDKLGEQIRTGQGNTDGVILWSTSRVVPGTYHLGLSWTDSGLTVADTVAAGGGGSIQTRLNPFTVTIIEAQAPNANAPQIQVTKPATTQTVDEGADTAITIEFKGTILDPNPVGPAITVFLDLDQQPGSGNERVLESNLSVNETTVTLNTTALAADTYFVAATIDDGVNAPVTDYAPGRIEVTETTGPGAETLTVIEPDLNLPVKPGTEIDILWSTNVEAAEATTSVFRQAVDAAGSPTGAEIAIPISTNGVTETTFVAAESGRFRISVRLTPTDSSAAVHLAHAPSFVQVSTLPKILWAGDLAEYDEEAEAQPNGAVFEGHNFEDNAGGVFAGGEDFNNDNIDDFVIVAQHGKPGFTNPTGIGDGEAYLIRGSRTRFRGSYSLNSVSSSLLPGTVLTGLPPDISLPASTTWGMRSLFISSDADGDGVGELMFGFPDVSKLLRSGSPVARNDMFENGGVIAVSSQNQVIRGDGNLDTAGSRLQLEAVGMGFDEAVIGPEPGADGGNASQCNLDWEWMVDNFSPFAGECPTEVACPESSECPAGGAICPDIEISGSPVGCSTGSAVPPATLADDCPKLCPETNTLCYPVDSSPQYPPHASTVGFGCPPEVPDDSISGCFRNVYTLVAPDGISDVLVQPTHGFASYLANDFINYYANAHAGHFPCDDYTWTEMPCPSCWDPGLPSAPNPNNPVPCSCEQWTYNWTTEEWVVNIDYAVPTDLFCEFNTWDLNTPNPSPGGDPLALNTEEIAGPCGDQNNAIRAALFTNRPFVDTDSDLEDFSSYSPRVGSGFYRDETAPGVANRPSQPWGCRIIGRPVDGSHLDLGKFGASITQSGNELIISAPTRDVRVGDFYGFSHDYLNGGVGYMFTNIDLWSLTPGNPAGGDLGFGIPPKPHLYEAGGGGHTLDPVGITARRETVFVRASVADTSGGLGIGGRTDEKIENILGIPDFNVDTRADILIGTPLARSKDGVAYVIFRRANSLEGDYVLNKLALDPFDFDRLAGLYIVGNAGEKAQFGSSLAGGSAATTSTFDFNGDGVDDVAIGSPNGNGGTGEVLIVFGANDLTSPANGLSVDALLKDGKGALITGVAAGSEFGYNIANAGDIDGDGSDDLLIAAPFATPKFDSTPENAVDSLDTAGLDRNLDGAGDDVSGPFGIPDNKTDGWDKLEGAGLVYVIFSSADTSKWSTTDGRIISADRLGTAELPGFIIAGRRGVDLTPPDPSRPHLGDRLGGGDAADKLEGNRHKDEDAGRSRGLAAVGDVDGDGKADFMIGSVLADPRVDPKTGIGTVNGGEGYLIYGFSQD
ncbi:MAG: hypothetical protein GY842_20350 [bacterium]|nr:hypothetical protein [bacterium]